VVFDAEDGQLYRVVVNDEEQYSIWPVDTAALVRDRGRAWHRSERAA